MPIARINWGVSSSASSPHYENELLVGYALFDWLTDRPPRDGSEFMQARSGVEDAWITGRDYTLDAEFRFIPDKPSTSPERSVVAGPNSWQAFLDYARAKNPFRFVPNANTPDFYVESCYLVEPIRGFGGNLADLSRGVRLVLRSTSMDFTQAMRGVALEYKAGEHLTNVSSGASFSRASEGWYNRAPTTGTQGPVLGSAGSGVLRDLYRTSSSERATLLEWASTNFVRHSEDLSQATWTKTGVTAVGNSYSAPVSSGSTAASLVSMSVASTFHIAVSTQVHFTTGTIFSLTGRFRARELGYLELYAQAATGTIRMGFEVDTYLGTIATTGNTLSGGGAVVSTPTIRQLNDGWYEASISGTLSSSTAGNLIVRAVSTSGDIAWVATTSQAFYGWGFQMEVATTDGYVARPSAYIPTSSAAVARSADVLTFDWPWKPQPMYAYLKFEERGTAFARRGALMTIGSAAGLSFLIEENGSTQYRAYASTGTPVGSAGINSTHLAGDIVELLGLLSSDGSVRLVRSVNGSTEVTDTASTVLPGGLMSTWGEARVAFNSYVNGGNAGAMALIHAKLGFSTGVTDIAAARSA